MVLVAVEEITQRDYNLYEAAYKQAKTLIKSRTPGYSGRCWFFHNFGGRNIIISDLGVQSKHGCYLPDFSIFC